jgi:hypothetical protein
MATNCLGCGRRIKRTDMPEHPLCLPCLRREIRAAIHEGRRITRAFQAQGLPDEAIMRIWERRAGLRWDEASQTHIEIGPADAA